jgi:hypothetical protein
LGAVAELQDAGVWVRKVGSCGESVFMDEATARDHAVSTVPQGRRGSATLTVRTLANGRVVARCV